MSSGCEPFALKEEDAMKLLATQAHIGTTNVDFQMESYIYARRFDGVHVLNIRKTWEKLLLAARAIAAIENPADICVISARPYAQRALLKFAAHTGATPIFGRYTPGCLTNQSQKGFKEPRLLVISDPRADHQAVIESSYMNIPVISFCNSDSPLKHVDIAIPCNNKGEQSIGLMWWLLAREVLTLKGKISRQTGLRLDDKEIMPDLYFYRDPQEQEKEEAVEVPAVAEAEFINDAVDVAPDFSAPVDIKDWATETANWQQTKATEGDASAQWGAPVEQKW